MWSDRAREVIAQVHRDLPADATLAERQRAIDAAYPFGERAYSPYKTWLRLRKAYLRPFGYVGPREKPSQLTLFPRDPATGRPIL